MNDSPISPTSPLQPQHLPSTTPAKNKHYHLFTLGYKAEHQAKHEQQIRIIVRSNLHGIKRDKKVIAGMGRFFER